MDVKLKVVLGKQKGHLLTFGRGEFVFGRGPECHVRPDSPLVSRQHCLLRIQDQEIWLRDLGSRNGTLVNGSLVTTDRTLHHGDQLQVGPLVLEVVLPPAADVIPEGTPQSPNQTLENSDPVSETVG